ncbi:MAG: DNA-directed RNA polymerase subunit A' [Candidatus Hydrothermarchaeota archaeon]
MANIRKRISEIHFELLSPDEIRNISVTPIITADTYDEDGYPIEKGLMDPKLGVIDPGLRCRTCGGRVGDCPGHFGHIDLAAPVIHVGFANLIHKFLLSTCRKCSRLLLPDEEIEKFKEEMDLLREKDFDPYVIKDSVYKQTRKVKKCPHCGEVQGEIKFEKPTTFFEDNNRLTPSDVRDRLERITNEDAELLGVNTKVCRPEWMVLTVLPIPPVTVRPSITLESGERSEDDLTHKLVDILRINQRLRENKEAGAPQLIIEDLWELLQYHVTTYFNNEVSGLPPARHRSGRPLRTLSQRLKGKEGRFRSNLSGKRVNFSARTVISPDPNISITEVGVPEVMARELTIPVRVTANNIEDIKKFVINGPNKYPGANYVIRQDGKRIKLSENNTEKIAEELEYGMIVERHLMNGDIVLFNRQPSLHRMSIMAHRVVVMPYKTFRLNLCVCPPYNADFDGDEMNLHVIQGEEAKAEAEVLMRVEEHILSPRFGGPIIGGIHDHISGVYLLTKKDSFFTKEEALSMLRSANIKTKLPEPACIENGTPLWSGKQIFSFLLPDDLNIIYKGKGCQKCKECKEEECPNEAYVKIENGEIKSGALDERSFGAFAGILLEEIIKDYGVDRAREFLDLASRLVLFVLMKKGFTTGIDDEDIPQDAMERIEEVLNLSEDTVAELIEAYDQGILEPYPGRSLNETLELRIMQELGAARNKAGEIAEEYLGSENHAVIMARTGARGSILNLTQISGCVGQQSVRGERIHRGYRDRTLPHFRQWDLRPRARGFVRSSYKKGLDPIEFFFHAMGGREGLVDTAVRTSQSGYMQRRLINALQDLKVEYDGTVRDSRGVIISFRAGEDGVDPAKKGWEKKINVKEIVAKVTGEEK